jgi:hypothetical protein
MVAGALSCRRAKFGSRSAAPAATGQAAENRDLRAHKIVDAGHLLQAVFQHTWAGQEITRKLIAGAY